MHSLREYLVFFLNSKFKVTKLINLIIRYWFRCLPPTLVYLVFRVYVTCSVVFGSFQMQSFVSFWILLGLTKWAGDLQVKARSAYSALLRSFITVQSSLVS